MSGRPALIECCAEEYCALSRPTQDLYDVQVGMLNPSKGFAGLKGEDLGKKGSLAFYDIETKAITINTNSDKRRTQPLTQVLSHEMTHAIDDLYDCGVEKNVEMLVRGLGGSDVSSVRQLVSQVLPEDIRGEYRRQAHTEELFIHETGAYIFEGIFKDMREGKFADILARYEAVTSVTSRRGDTDAETRGKETAQEIVAVAIGSISSAMIAHIEASRGADLSPEREHLLKELIKINKAVQPAYERANEKLAKIEEGGRAVKTGDPRRKRQMTEDVIESRILARESELSKNLANSMRDALIRTEKKLCGKVKYGDLKRTISPIRTRPVSSLGSRV